MKNIVTVADSTNIDTLAKLANELWPNHSLQELTCDFAQLVKQNDVLLLIIYAYDVPVGFAHCQLRHEYVEGTKTSPVGYLEGVFVKAEFRRRGFGRQLLKECEAWAKSKGCKEFASDCSIENIFSLQFHLANGFCEANRIICFKKDI